MAGAPAAPWRAAGDHLLLYVRVTPRAGRDAIGGVERREDGRAVLRIALRAAPADGEANDALIRLLADALHLPRRDVVLAAGASARLKTIRLPLASRAAVEAVLSL